MAKVEVEVGDFIVTLSFTTKDLYTASPLGCHAGCLGNVSAACKPKADTRSWAVSMAGEDVQTKLKENDLYRKIMDGFVAGSKAAWGGWDTAGTTYLNKGHWIISAPWGFNPGHDYAPGDIGTRELMDLIAQYCDHEPEKYGRYTMTDGTDCGAHDNNSGRPCTRTMIWHPPGITVTKKDLLTRVTGVYKPREVPKPKPEPKLEPVVVEKVKPPRPVRKLHNLKKAQPKTYGPPSRMKYRRAA